MNRQEIEQRFDKKFGDYIIDGEWCTFETNKDIKSFFFDEILPEVLRNITETKLNLLNRTERDYNFTGENQKYYDKAQIDAYNNVIELAKEKYNITL